MKKYELTNDTMKLDGHTLCRIKALRNFGNVKKGDLGGWVESEENLSHGGNCWVYGEAKIFGKSYVCGDAMVSGEAWIYDNARVYGEARVYGNTEVHGIAKIFGSVILPIGKIGQNASIAHDTDYLTIGPIGSRNGITTFYRDANNGICVTCGCFEGTLDEFEQAVMKTYEDNKHGRVYRICINAAREHFDA